MLSRKDGSITDVIRRTETPVARVDQLSTGRSCLRELLDTRISVPTIAERLDSEGGRDLVFRHDKRPRIRCAYRSAAAFVSACQMSCSKTTGHGLSLCRPISRTGSIRVVRSHSKAHNHDSGSPITDLLPSLNDRERSSPEGGSLSARVREPHSQSRRKARCCAVQAA